LPQTVLATAFSSAKPIPKIARASKPVAAE
jgi:hypothetical protein